MIVSDESNDQNKWEGEIFSLARRVEFKGSLFDALKIRWLLRIKKKIYKIL